ncbi:SDR family oxidoreductase [Paenibacillus sp. JSM ZJ436]|uniref:SDR family oxidoreductase n=1 Tax=Paenibacillus sp. JSM ZJ436 TaxID=3376190 RepID=UPI0037B15C3B
MKTAVFGANGQIGRIFTDLWIREQHGEVRALIRSSDQAGYFEELGADPVLLNLKDDVNTLAKALEGCEAVVFAAGSGGDTGADMTLLIDLDGAVKASEAALKAGIDRFVLVSAMGAGERERWSDSIKPYYVAKHYADQAVESSGLSYTILRPGALTNDEGSGNIEAGPSLEPGSIPRADVAAAIVTALLEPNTQGKSFELIEGSTPISEALSKL